MENNRLHKEKIKNLLVSCGLIGKNEKVHYIYLGETIYDKDKLAAFAGIVKYHLIFPCFTVAVAPEYRNRGIGTKISSDVVNKWKGPIFLTVLKNNKSAIKIYEQLGFKKICTWKKLQNTPQWLMIRFWKKKKW